MPFKKSETMTQPEWEAKGKELFGEDKFKWKFECPACGNVASAEDFRPYKDKGATPNSATQECIGRYAPCPEKHTQFMCDGKVKVPKETKPCDWAAYGLFRGPNFVQREDGGESPVFAFAEGL